MSEKAHVKVLLEKERLLNRITHKFHDARDLDEILLTIPAGPPSTSSWKSTTLSSSGSSA